MCVCTVTIETQYLLYCRNNNDNCCKLLAQYVCHTSHMFKLPAVALLIPSKDYIKFHCIGSTSLEMPYEFCNKHCFFMSLNSVSKHDHPLNWLLPLES